MNNADMRLTRKTLAPMTKTEALCKKCQTKPKHVVRYVDYEKVNSIYQAECHGMFEQIGFETIKEPGKIIFFDNDRNIGENAPD